MVQRHQHLLTVSADARFLRSASTSHTSGVASISHVYNIVVPEEDTHAHAHTLIHAGCRGPVSETLRRRRSRQRETRKQIAGVCCGFRRKSNITGCLAELFSLSLSPSLSPLSLSLSLSLSLPPLSPPLPPPLCLSLAFTRCGRLAASTENRAHSSVARIARAAVGGPRG